MAGAMRAGELVAGRFELVALAGEGGMGQVWRARDRTGGAEVALKRMRFESAEGAARFAREAEVLAGLRHPSIVRYVAHGATEAGEPWLAMEWLDGEDLEARLEREGLTLAESVAIARQVAEALGAAHARRVVHRDIKPSNVLLVGGRTDAVRVLDFGIARRLGRETGATGTGAVIGTVGYMAPEQARGERTLDARADVFALGCVLYECVTGRAAFQGEHVAAVLIKVLLEEPPRLCEAREGVPAALDELVFRMLAKDPAGRPADGAAVARELGALDLSAAPARRAPASVQPPSLGRVEQRLMTLVLAAGALARDEGGVSAETLAAGALARDEGGVSAEAPTAPAPGVVLSSLAESAREHGARLDAVADGSVIALLEGTGAATDLVARAARVALAMRRALPEARMAMATGRALGGERLPAGEVVDRAAERARAARAGGGVRLDEVTAGLLDLRFAVSGDEAGLELVREREAPQLARTLLGKPAPFVGREREMGTLVGLYDECLAEGAPRVVLLLGPAGIGKSRVRYELLRRLEQHESAPQVWMGRGDERTARSPYGMLAPSIRDAAGVKMDEPPAVQQQKLRARVARTVRESECDRTAVFLGEMIGTRFPDAGDPVLAHARRDAMAMSDQMRLAWQRWLEAELEAGPVLIVLEDLHWGDAPSVSLVDLSLKNLRERAWMVLVPARPEVLEVFPGLFGERDVVSYTLGPLSARAGEKLVRAVLGDRVSAERASRMAALSEGNALALEEFVRAAAAGATEDVPATVMAMAQARLGALPEEARRVLRAASVLGQVFWAGAVSALLGGARSTTGVRDALGLLEEREVIAYLGEGRFAGDREYTFRHVVAAQAAYSMLTDEDRVLGHRLAGEWLERVGEPSAAVIAEHYDKAGERARAASAYVRACEQALASGDFAAVIERCERAGACGAQGEELGRAWLARAWAHFWRNEAGETRGAAERALGLLAEGSERAWEAAGRAMAAAQRAGDRDAALAYADRLLEALGEDRPGAALVAVAPAAAVACLYLGWRERAERLLLALGAVEARGVPLSVEARARLAGARAQHGLLSGDPARCLEQQQLAERLWSEAGEPRQVCRERTNVGYGLHELGQNAAAERVLAEVLGEAERLGLAHVAAVARHNLGSVLLRLARIDEAETIEREAVDAFARGGDRRLEGGSRVYLASILLAKGDRDAAESEARRAVELLAAAPPVRPLALAVLASVLCATRPAEALEAAREAHAALDAGDVEEGEGQIRLALAEAFFATGNEGAARDAIRTARERLLARAAKISHAGYRESFLSNVPEHARTLALAREWLGESDVGDGRRPARD